MPHSCLQVHLMTSLRNTLLHLNMVVRPYYLLYRPGSLPTASVPLSTSLSWRPTEAESNPDKTWIPENELICIWLKVELPHLSGPCAQLSPDYYGVHFAEYVAVWPQSDDSLSKPRRSEMKPRRAFTC